MINLTNLAKSNVSSFAVLAAMKHSVFADHGSLASTPRQSDDIPRLVENVEMIFPSSSAAPSNKKMTVHVDTADAMSVSLGLYVCFVMCSSSNLPSNHLVLCRLQ